MLFNKKVHFSESPKGFSVNYVGPPAVSVQERDKASVQGEEEGKAQATQFYQNEIQKLREEFAARQNTLLQSINSKVEETLGELENRLPDLVLGLVERVLPGVEFDHKAIEEIVRSMISEFTNEDEALEVFLCPEDLNLLKGMSTPDKPAEPNQDDGGFASAIAGIFDNLDGDDALLPDLPKVSFFADESLQRGDCQVKSRFGLLDGRISTKLRRIEEGLKGDG